MEPIYTVARTLLLPLLRLLFRWEIIGLAKIPRTGPAIIAPNHISNFDPLCVAFLVDRARRRPRFLAKASLWKNPVLRFVFDGAGQIPVERGSGAREPLEAAIEAVRRGEVVVLYPEATITTTEDLTPMRGKKGIARLALATGAPVYPVAVWGAQWWIPKNRKGRHRFWQRIMMSVGDPLTLTDADPADQDALQAFSDDVMAEVDRLVRELHKLHPEGAAIPPRKA